MVDISPLGIFQVGEQVEAVFPDDGYWYPADAGTTIQCRFHPDFFLGGGPINIYNVSI